MFRSKFRFGVPGGGSYPGTLTDERMPPPLSGTVMARLTDSTPGRVETRSTMSE